MGAEGHTRQGRIPNKESHLNYSAIRELSLLLLLYLEEASISSIIIINTASTPPSIRLGGLSPHFATSSKEN